MPLSFSYRQLPPTPEPVSKQSNAIPRAFRTWHEAIPDEPAPITQTRLSPHPWRRIWTELSWRPRPDRGRGGVSGVALPPEDVVDQRFHTVQEEHAVEVIELVLDGAGLEAQALDAPPRCSTTTRVARLTLAVTSGRLRQPSRATSDPSAATILGFASTGGRWTSRPSGAPRRPRRPPAPAGRSAGRRSPRSARRSRIVASNSPATASTSPAWTGAATCFSIGSG